VAEHDEPTEDDDTATPSGRRRPIDLTPSLHTAGHEVELLHAEDVPDTAPVLHTDDDGENAADRIDGDIATRGFHP